MRDKYKTIWNLFSDVEEVREIENFISEAINDEGVLKDEDYITEVVTIYRDAIDLYYEDKEAYEDEKQDFYNDIERIKPKYREVDLGFFYKKTMY